MCTPYTIYMHYFKGVKRNKNMHNRLDLTPSFLMSKVSKVLYTIYIHLMVHMLKVSKESKTTYSNKRMLTVASFFNLK